MVEKQCVQHGYFSIINAFGIICWASFFHEFLSSTTWLQGCSISYCSYNYCSVIISNSQISVPCKNKLFFSPPLRTGYETCPRSHSWTMIKPKFVHPTDIIELLISAKNYEEADKTPNQRLFMS